MSKIVIDELIKVRKDLSEKIDLLEQTVPGVSHSRKKSEQRAKKEWEKLVHDRYCTQQILWSIYNIEDY